MNPIRIGLTLSVGLLLLASIAPSIPAGSTSGLQPGDRVTIGNSGCTLNWVYDGDDGRVFMGTAGHCGSLGQTARVPGYGTIGTIVYDNDGGIDFA